MSAGIMLPKLHVKKSVNLSRKAFRNATSGLMDSLSGRYLQMESDTSTRPG
jgi:hypothetical protein